MRLLAGILPVPLVVCVTLLFVGVLTRSKSLALWGDIMLAVSFGLTSVVLLYFGSTWIGIAFAFPAIRQAYVLLAPSVKQLRRG